MMMANVGIGLLEPDPDEVGKHGPVVGGRVVLDHTTGQPCPLSKAGTETA